MKRTTGLAIICAIALAQHIGAQGTTLDALSAPKVVEQIRVKPARHKDKTVKCAVDAQKTFDTLRAATTFAAERAISVTTPTPNPLELAMTAGIEEADDPSHAAVMKIVEALLAIPPIVQPDAAAVADTTRNSMNQAMTRESARAKVPKYGTAQDET